MLEVITAPDNSLGVYKLEVDALIVTVTKTNARGQDWYYSQDLAADPQDPPVLLLAIQPNSLTDDEVQHRLEKEIRERMQAKEA